jgi:hypothetical protein
MSDDGSPPPPPPPPNLTPPPGYAAYQGTYADAVPLKRVRGLTKALLIVIGVYVVAAVVVLAMTPAAVDSAKDFLADRISEDEFTDDYAAFGGASLLMSLMQLAIVVLSIIWLFRAAKNHRSLGRRTTWAPLWAVFGWLLPPFLFIIPLLMLRETWKASDPAVPAGDERWKQNGESPLVWIWWVLFGVAPVVVQVLGLRPWENAMSNDNLDIADAIDDRLGLLVAQWVIAIVGAIAWALVVRAITARHTALTGEARR